MDCPSVEETADSWRPPSPILQNGNGKDANGGGGGHLYLKEPNGTGPQNGLTPHHHQRKCCTCCCAPMADHELVPPPVGQGLCEKLCQGSTAGGSRDREDVCGLWTFRPRWLQKFANKQAFLAVFCLTSVLQGMYYTYFVSVLTTIEKLYQIQSKTTGIIMSATEIGQIGGALLLTYYGGQGHRPRWIACGMLVFALASILCSTPHFLFGGEILFPSSGAGGAEPGSLNYTYQEMSSKLCRDTDETRASSLLFALRSVNDTGGQWESSPAIPDLLRSRNKACDSPERSSQQTRITHMVLSVFFVSLLFIGIGATAVYTLGIPYIDDNVATRESPLYFGITIGVRIFGPVFGFLLGSFCTGVYVNFPFEGPGISTDDPQWIGAWWLGVFIVGAALILTAFPMMAFPKKLPPQSESTPVTAFLLSQPPPEKLGNGNCHHDHRCLQPPPSSQGHVCNHQSQVVLLRGRKVPKTPSLKDFPAAVRRLLKNDILLCRTASSVLHILPIAGLYTFLPKYLESQFQLTATRANMIVGMAGILVMGAGIFASGMFMRKFKPNARFVARWIALAALAYSLGMVILMWLGCPLNSYVGLDQNMALQHRVGGMSACNSSCACPVGEFAPICTTGGDTYLSPCMAGCTRVIHAETGEQLLYGECSCLKSGVTAVNGFCPLDCNNLVWYTVIFSVFVLIHSTSEVGSMLLTLRCVDPQDKAMALGLISFAIGLFGNVPCPIIYGAVVDSACLFWEDNCGEPGACRVYDPVRFRMVFHGVTALLMLAAFVVDAIIWYKSSNIQFQDYDDADRDDAAATGDGVCCTQFETSV